MNIKEVAEISRLPAKTIRFYEDIGLVRPGRAPNGYRRFSERDLHKLAFVGRARSLGFSIDDCRTLLSLYEDRGRTSSEVKQIAEDHLRQIERKIIELEAMKHALSELIASCRGDHRPDCPIIRDLAGDAAISERYRPENAA